MGLTDNPILEEILKFIANHEQEDPAHLLLSGKIPDGFPKQEVAEQIASRQKAKQKLPSLYENKSLLFPSAISIEQCSSEATATFKASLTKGDKLTDLTGGFGIDTAYLSKQFEQTNYVEQNEELCAIAKYNFHQLVRKDILVHHTDAISFLESMQKVDCIYIDPARRDKNNQKVYGWGDCQPDLVANLTLMLSKSNVIIAKAAPMLDISQAIKELNQQVAHVYIVEWKGEVRELLFVITNTITANPTIHAVILDHDGKVASQFISSFEEEKNYPSAVGMPKTYLYEPSPAIMKSGFFNTLAKEFKLEKLHPNTQLFTSNDIRVDFPGKTYQINANIPAQKKALKAQLPGMKANLKCRNFPMDIKVLKKKLAIKDGGNDYLFALTLSDSSKRILVCNKIN